MTGTFISVRFGVPRDGSAHTVQQHPRPPKHTIMRSRAHTFPTENGGGAQPLYLGGHGYVEWIWNLDCEFQRVSNQWWHSHCLVHESMWLSGALHITESDVPTLRCV